MKFPDSIRKYQKAIESTKESTILFSIEQKATFLSQSKLGGYPYFPYDYPIDYPTLSYPTNLTINPTPWPKHPQTGKELPLLIQINFSEVPHLDPFPRKGILQIFVDDKNWYNLQSNIRVLYHSEVIDDKDYQFNNFGDVGGILEEFRVKESSLSFKKVEEYVTVSDFRFTKLFADFSFKGKSFYEILYSKEENLYKDYLKITDHRFSECKELGYGRNKMGGYHYSQNAKDPRSNQGEWDNSILLFQFQNYDNLSWGDGGSAQFFIKRQDLEGLNFSNLLFHWDST